MLAKRVLELTTKESMALGHNYIGCEHILLGLIADEGGMAGKVLRRMGVELRTTRRAVVTALSGYVHAQQPTPTAVTPADALAEIRERLDAIERRLGSDPGRAARRKRPGASTWTRHPTVVERPGVSPPHMWSNARASQTAARRWPRRT